jgi:voltage-gated potassium channel
VSVYRIRFALPRMPSDPVPPRSVLEHPQARSRREAIWRIIFLSDTRAGRLFDVVLLWLIGASVLLVALESVDALRERYGTAMRAAEWGFTALFTIEYGVRLAVVRNRWRYASSFFGVVDLVSILPLYLELVLPDSHYLMTIRILRLLRIFRVLKMGRHLGEAAILLNAIRASRDKIIVFLLGVGALVCVEGTIMYVLENERNPDFSSIPQSVYWAVVTLTTVGFGDITPVTVLGKMMATVVMLTGFSIIAVPIGVVTAELGREMGIERRHEVRCRECGWSEHDPRALYCQQCGTPLG